METVDELKQLTANLEGKLTEAMSNLTRLKVELKLKDGGMISISEVQKWLTNTDAASTTIYIPIMGDVVGDIFLFMSNNSTNMFVDLMMNRPVGTTTFLSEFEKSALQELGNITTGVIVTEIADMLGLSMMLTVPNLATDMVGALVDQVLIEYGETSNELMALNFPYAVTVEDKTAEGCFLLFFNKASSDLIVAKLKEKHG